MYKPTLRKTIVLVILLFLTAVLTSALTAYLVARSQTNIRFVAQPREDNQDYGYLEIDGKEYRQLYTTTQDDIGNGLHIHRIDLRSTDKPSSAD
jgi:hypothetical protein